MGRPWSRETALLLLPLIPGNEADGAGDGWVLEPLDVLYQRDDNRAVLPLGSFDLFDLFRQGLVGGEHLAEFDEGAYDENVHQRGAVAVEDGREHQHAVLRESIRRQARIAVLLGTGHKL